MLQQWSRNIQEIPVTLGLVVIHFVVYFLVWRVDPSFSAWLVNASGGETLMSFGAQYSPAIWEGEVYRLFLCGFLHGNVLHLLLNNMGLYVLGRLLERLLGSGSFFLLYIISLFAGSVASLMWTSPLAISVGASGAIFGIAGGLMIFLVFDIKSRFVVTSVSGRIFFFALIAFNFFLGEWVESINGVAHLGGFVGGMVFTFFFWSRIPGVSVPRSLGSGVFGVGLVVLGVITYQGMNPYDGPKWTLYKGVEAFQAGNGELARSYFLKAKAQSPKDRMVLDFLGRLYVQMEDWKGAEKIYDRLRQQRPGDWDYWLQWITALSESGRVKEARVSLALAKKQFAKKFDNEVLRALFYSAAQQSKEAIHLYQRLLERAPFDANLNNNLAWLLITARDRRFRNPALALKHALIAVRRSDAQIAAYLDTLATVYFHLGRWREAIETEKKALSLMNAKNLKTVLKRQLKKFEEALKRETKATKGTSSKMPVQRERGTKESRPKKDARHPTTKRNTK